jgi:hypothetical protein
MFNYNPRKHTSFGEPRSGTITSDVDVQRFKTESAKTVFELTGKSGKTITCIAWGIHLVEKDEKATVFGYEKNNVFIVQKILKNYEI